MSSRQWGKRIYRVHDLGCCVSYWVQMCGDQHVAKMPFSSKILIVLLEFISDVIFSLWSGILAYPHTCPPPRHHLTHVMVTKEGSKETWLSGHCPGTFLLGSELQGCAPPQNAKLCPITFLIMPDHPSSSETWYNPSPPPPIDGSMSVVHGCLVCWECWPLLEGMAHNHFLPPLASTLISVNGLLVGITSAVHWLSCLLLKISFHRPLQYLWDETRAVAEIHFSSFLSF